MYHNPLTHLGLLFGSDSEKWFWRPTKKFKVSIWHSVTLGHLSQEQALNQNDICTSSFIYKIVVFFWWAEGPIHIQLFTWHLILAVCSGITRHGVHGCRYSAGDLVKMSACKASKYLNPYANLSSLPIVKFKPENAILLHKACKPIVQHQMSKEII